jgi:hypothetical protein
VHEQANESSEALLELVEKMDESHTSRMRKQCRASGQKIVAGNSVEFCGRHALGNVKVAQGDRVRIPPTGLIVNLMMKCRSWIVSAPPLRTSGGVIAGGAMNWRRAIKVFMPQDLLLLVAVSGIWAVARCAALCWFASGLSS